MLPQNALSTNPVVGNFIQGRAQTVNLLVDYESGGIGLNNPSAGMLYQIWKGELLNLRDIYISAPNTPRTHLVSTGFACTEISIAFDQNMRPHVAYMDGSFARFYWFDPTIPGPAILTLPAGSRNPKVTLDDKREIHSSDSDIILAYMRGTSLYFRFQRERYLIERLLKTNVVGDLLKIGMADSSRVQFQFGVRMTQEELIEKLAAGSPISGSTPVTEDDSTSPSSSDLWELDSGD